MRRLFWLAMGITIGALVVRRLSRIAERLTPRGVASTLGDALTELSESLRDFAGDVREAMGEREVQLRAGTGLDGTLGKLSDDPADGIGHNSSKSSGDQ
jgi:hypothetical protein